jgi:phage replication-related protein YjqB (UPF0714/DUF867 family)
MADLFANWAALSAAEVLNVDYRLPIKFNRSQVASIAVHGGSIEPGSSEVALGVAASCRHNYYALEGIKSSGNSDLHLTSTNYDEPQGIGLVARMDYCFSFHGMADQSAGVAETYVGGLDTANRDAVILALQGAGFTASIGTAELNGSSPANITNKTRQATGVQIELSNTLRASFFTAGSLTRANRETGLRTDTFYKYVKAVSSVANDIGGGASQTPQYRLNEPMSVDFMSDYETWINYNWEKLSRAPAPLSGTTLPQSGPFNVGDRFYKTDTKSIYVLVVKDAAWGWHWRPVHDAISPWLTVPTTVMKIAGWTLNPTPANPFQIAMDNRGRVYWRGIIGFTAGSMSRGVSYGLFGPPPIGIRPRGAGTFMLGHETLAVSSVATSLQGYQGARIFIPNDGVSDSTVRCFGGNADFNRVHLAGVAYAAGSNMFWDV